MIYDSAYPFLRGHSLGHRSKSGNFLSSSAQIEAYATTVTESLPENTDNVDGCGLDVPVFIRPLLSGKDRYEDYVSFKCEIFVFSRYI